MEPLQRPPLWGLVLLGAFFLGVRSLTAYVALGGGAGTMTAFGWIGVVFLSCLGAFISVVLRKVDQGARSAVPAGAADAVRSRE